MAVDLTLTIDLQSSEVADFVISAARNFVDPELDSKRDYLASNGFDNGNAERAIGSVVSDSVHTAEIVEYDLIENATGAFVSKVKTQIIYTTELEIQVFHELWIKTGLADQEVQTIKNGFADFDFANHGDPNDFASSLGISSDKFEALAFYKITRGSEAVRKDNDDAVKAYYRGDEVYRD